MPSISGDGLQRGIRQTNPRLVADFHLLDLDGGEGTGADGSCDGGRADAGLGGGAVPGGRPGRRRHPRPVGNEKRTNLLVSACKRAYSFISFVNNF